MKNGHLSKGMSIEDIANKHKVDIGALKQELKKGIKVEKEHTGNNTKAARIAMDHLVEDPKYYTKLSKVGLEENKSSLNKDLVKEFIKHVINELNLDKLPPIKLSNNSQEAIDMHSWGGYMPGNKSIRIVTAKRHPADIFRTLAHELVHYKQDIEGRLKPNSGNTGSEEENEANSRAAVIMRNFAQAKPNLFEHLVKEIGENLSAAYPFKYVGGPDNKYTFQTEGFDYDVVFTLEDKDFDDGNYELAYNIKDKNIKELPLTKEGKAIRVNATVIAILLDFLKKNPNFLSVLIAPIDDKRYNLAKRFLDNNLPSNYTMEENGKYILIKNQT